MVLRSQGLGMRFTLISTQRRAEVHEDQRKYDIVVRGHPEWSGIFPI